MWFEDTLSRLMSLQIDSAFSEEVPCAVLHPEFPEGSSGAQRVTTVSGQTRIGPGQKRSWLSKARKVKQISKTGHKGVTANARVHAGLAAQFHLFETE